MTAAIGVSELQHVMIGWHIHELHISRHLRSPDDTAGVVLHALTAEYSSSVAAERMLQTLIRARSKSVQMPLTGRNSRARLNSSTVRPRSRTSQRAAWSALRAAADQSTEHIRPEPVETPHLFADPLLFPFFLFVFLFFSVSQLWAHPFIERQLKYI